TFEYDWLGNIAVSDDDAHAFFDRSSGVHVQVPSKPNQLLRATDHDDSVSAAHDSAGHMISLVVQRLDSGCTSASGCTHRFDYEWDEIGRLARARRWDYVGKYPSNEPP